MSDSETTEGPEADVAGSSRVTGHTARWVAIGVGVVLIAFIGVLATRKSADSDSISNKLLGQPVPAVQGATLDGGNFDIDQERNRWVVVNFFATWCIPCVREHPELVQFTQEHADDADVAVVSVSYTERGEVVQKFFDEHGGSWPVIADPDGQIALAFGTSQVPESYLINPEGVVVAKFHGVTADGLDAEIARQSGGSAGSGGSTTTTVGAAG